MDVNERLNIAANGFFGKDYNLLTDSQKFATIIRMDAQQE